MGSALDRASASTRNASKALQALDLKKSAIQALLLGADSEAINEIVTCISDAKACLASAESLLSEAHINATSLSMDADNQMNTRSGRE